MADALKEVSSLLQKPINNEMEVTTYIGELCSNVSSCSLFVEFIAKDEHRYQRLFRVGYSNRY